MFSAVVSDAVVTVRGCAQTHTHTNVRAHTQISTKWDRDLLQSDTMRALFGRTSTTRAHIRMFKHTHTPWHRYWHWHTHAFLLVRPVVNTHPDSQVETVKAAFALPCAVSLCPYNISCFVFLQFVFNYFIIYSTYIQYISTNNRITDCLLNVIQHGLVLHGPTGGFAYHLVATEAAVRPWKYIMIFLQAL